MDNKYITRYSNSLLSEMQDEQVTARPPTAGRPAGKEHFHSFMLEM